MVDAQRERDYLSIPQFLTQVNACAFSHLPQEQSIKRKAGGVIQIDDKLDLGPPMRLGQSYFNTYRPKLIRKLKYQKVLHPYSHSSRWDPKVRPLYVSFDLCKAQYTVKLGGWLQFTSNLVQLISAFKVLSFVHKS